MTTGRLVAAIGGLILIISLFLKWAGVDLPSSVTDAANALGQANPQVQDAINNAKDAASSNAFDIFGFMPFLFILIGLLAILPAALDLFNMEIELPFDISLVTLVGGVLALGAMLLVLDSPGSAKIGVWLALLGSIAITVGGVLQLRENGQDAASAVAASAPPAPQQQTYAPPPPAAPPQAPPAAPGPPPQQPPQAPRPGA